MKTDEHQQEHVMRMSITISVLQNLVQMLKKQLRAEGMEMRKPRSDKGKQRGAYKKKSK